MNLVGNACRKAARYRQLLVRHQGRFSFPYIGYVAKDQHQARDFALRIPNRGRALVNQVLCAVFRQ